jgi:hypothetical protein
MASAYYHPYEVNNSSVTPRGINERDQVNYRKLYKAYKGLPDPPEMDRRPLQPVPQPFTVGAQDMTYLMDQLKRTLGVPTLANDSLKNLLTRSALKYNNNARFKNNENYTLCDDEVAKVKKKRGKVRYHIDC